MWIWCEYTPMLHDTRPGLGAMWMGAAFSVFLSAFRGILTTSSVNAGYIYQSLVFGNTVS